MKLAIFIYHVYFTDGDFHDQENNSLWKNIVGSGYIQCLAREFYIWGITGLCEDCKKTFS